MKRCFAILMLLALGLEAQGATNSVPPLIVTGVKDPDAPILPPWMSPWRVSNSGAGPHKRPDTEREREKGRFAVGSGRANGQMRHSDVDIGQPNISIGQPNVSIGRPNTAIGQPNVNIGQPNVNMGQPNIFIGRPNTAIGQPNVNIGQPNVNIGQPNVNIGQPNVNIGQPNVQIGRPNVQIGRPNVNIGPANPGVGQPNFNSAGKSNFSGQPMNRNGGRQATPEERK